MSKKKLSYFKVFTIISFVLVISTLGSLLIIDTPLLNGQTIRFTDENKDILRGKYYIGERDAGIIFLEGFGSDQIALRNVMTEFAQLKIHMFSFDFSGQGKSSGVLGFDNAETDRLAKQALLSKEVFKNLTGLTDNQIMFFGHSMGARVALQAATMDSNNIAGLILFGTQLNLIPNIQSSFFTGVEDTNLTWVQNLGPSNPDIDTLMISGKLDDVLTPEAANKLFQKLTNQTATSGYEQIVEISGVTKELLIIKGLVHNYEVYSSKAILKSLSFANEKLGINSRQIFNSARTMGRITLWFISLISLFGSIILGSKWLDIKSSIQEEKIDNGKESEPELQEEPDQLKILNTKKYLWMKLLLLFASLPIAVILASIFLAIPLGMPVFNIIYVGIFGGFGLLLFLLFRIGKMPATSGKWKPNFRIIKDDINWFNILAASAAFLCIVLFSILFTRSGFFFVYPLNSRLIWLVLFTIFSIPGFYMGQLEMQIIRKQKSKIGPFFAWNTLIILIPFFLFTIFYLILNSTSGFLGGFHGLVILAIVITSGDIFYKLSKNVLITAIFQSFLLQLLVLPQGSLFLVFY